MSDSPWHTVTIRVPFVSPNHANIAKDVIGVDKELQGHAVKREMIVEGDELVATFQTLTVRLARLTLNAFLENVELIVRTLDEFGPDAALSSANP
ncbi:transcription factor Pcc1 [Serendipita vermifera]|nr:transcription factor Pcc1 [Serendipita vermifera]